MNDPVITKWGTIFEDENGELVVDSFHLTRAKRSPFSDELQLLMAIKKRIDTELEAMMDDLV